MFFDCHHQIVGQTENQSKRERYPMFFIEALPLFLLKHGSTHQRIEMFPYKMDTLYLNQQDLQNSSDIECSRMVFHFGPDFHLSLDQQDLQI